MLLAYGQKNTTPHLINSRVYTNPRSLAIRLTHHEPSRQIVPQSPALTATA